MPRSPAARRKSVPLVIHAYLQTTQRGASLYTLDDTKGVCEREEPFEPMQKKSASCSLPSFVPSLDLGIKPLRPCESIAFEGILS